MTETPGERIPVPALVAHRGYAAQYPENTLEGIEAALEAGAQYIEVDIQLSAEGIPVLFHDVTLQRTTGAPGIVMEHTLAQLQTLCAGERTRFGERFSAVRIPTLSALVELLLNWPTASVFLELKEESLAHFGTTAMVECVIQLSRPLAQRRILISYDSTALEESRRQAQVRTGLVVKRYDEVAHSIASALEPDYLICNVTKLPPASETLWPGHWSWMFYEVTDPGLALQLYQRGGHLIETMDIGNMMRHPLFRETVTK